jgi:hypothetical protein
MDIEKYLVILKGEDKTANIISYEYQGGRVLIRFNSPDKTYEYSRSNFQFYSNPSEIKINDVEKTLAFGDIFNVKKILYFNPYCKIIFNNGSSKTVSADLLEIREKSDHVSEDRFNYFKEISKIVSVRTEDGTALLTKEYEKVNFVEKETALYQYLNPKDNRIINIKNSMPLIFPFGSNKSQYSAVENALNNQISVIEGPPGTGKTQTILNIIANIISRGKSVAVVSNNNAATANVYEKLSEKGFGFICATLGKKENKIEFISNQNGLYPHFNIESDDYRGINEISKLNKKLDEIFELKNKKAIDTETLNELKIEHEYYRKYKSLNEFLKIRSVNSLNSNSIIRLRTQIEDKEAKGEGINLWFKLIAIILYGIGNFKFYKLPLNEILEMLNEIYFLVKENEMKKQINSISEKLYRLDDKVTLEQLKKLSYTYLMSYLDSKFSRKRK